MLPWAPGLGGIPQTLARGQDEEVLLAAGQGLVDGGVVLRDALEQSGARGADGQGLGMAPQEVHGAEARLVREGADVVDHRRDVEAIRPPHQDHDLWDWQQLNAAGEVRGGGVVGSRVRLLCCGTRGCPMSAIPRTQYEAWARSHVAFGGGGGSSHDELPELAHLKALEKSLGIKDQSCPVLRLSHKTVW